MIKKLLFILTIFVLVNLNGEAKWPKLFQSDNLKVKIYQPQISSFKGNTIECHSALKILKDKKVSYGNIVLKARVSVNRTEDKVTFRNLEVVSIKLSDKREKKENTLLKEIEATLPPPKVTFTVSQFAALLEPLDLATINPDEAKLETTPPEIIFSEEEAFLVIIDGAAKLSKMDSSSLLRIINSPELIVYDSTQKKYYLYLNFAWFENSELNDYWTIARTTPASLKQTFPKLELKTPREIKIFVRKKSAELIQTFGKPELEMIEGTDLVYVTNTQSNIFVQLGEQRIFLLVTGRWFTANSKKGPWKFVPQSKLPADFSRIPLSSSKSDVLQSVASNPAAKDKLTETLIPETKSVSRKNVDYKVEYDGKIELKEVPESTLYYIVNASQPTFKYKDLYFSCADGIWYVSDVSVNLGRLFVNLF